MIGPWQPPTEREQLKNLFDLGYFAGDEWRQVKDFLFGSAAVRDAMERYVAFHDITNEEPSEFMLRPRCGLPDFVRTPEEARLSKWRMLDVTTAHRLSGLNPLSAEREQAAWTEAIQAWNSVCGIRMTETAEFGRANIYADPGSTGPGVLAYSYLPNDSGPDERLQQVYNRSTNWSYSLLLNVIIHELGHAIGLDHGPRGSIMQPTAGGDITRPMVWDIEQAVSRYGVASPRPESPTQPLTLKSGLSPGNYRIEPNETDYDMIVNDPIGRGRFRLVSEFEMG